MGTRACIRFDDLEGKPYCVYRGKDGGPENVMKDLESLLKAAVGRWSGAEIGQLISLFLGMTYRPNERIQDYELTEDFHGDEAYGYYVTWDRSRNAWTTTVDG